MSYYHYIKVGCDAYVDGDTCNEWFDVEGPKITSGRRQLPHGWTTVRTERGVLDICPVCSINLGLVSKKVMAILEQIEERNHYGTLCDARIRANKRYSLKEDE